MPARASRRLRPTCCWTSISRRSCSHPEAHRGALLGVLSHDPRPSYQDDPARRYGMGFAGFDIHFTVSEGRLTVVDVVPMEPSEKGSASQ